MTIGTGSADGRPRNVGAERASTVGRAKPVVLPGEPSERIWSDDLTTLHYGDSLEAYASWRRPTAIVSDGAYGVLGFEGDTTEHANLPRWYEPHIEQWSRYALPNTTLWFWNSEIGWASVHPILERHGWRYVNANIWNKGKAHIAGNINTGTIRRFPVVTEVCVQYVFEARIGGRLLKHWLLDEWKRTGLPLSQANAACGVKDAAVRKYLDQGHLWYFPPADKFQRLSEHANCHGDPAGAPYFSIDGRIPLAAEQWASMRAKFRCPHGVTNVWERPALLSDERVKASDGRAVHLNQKPLDLMSRIIEACTEEGDVVWEPFGGLFTACIAARLGGRRSHGAEIDRTYFQYGVERVSEAAPSVRPLR